MRVAFLTASISRLGGGIFEIERRLAQTLAGLPNTAVEVFGLEDQHTLADLPLWDPLKPRTFGHAGPASFGYSTELRNAFHAHPADIGHLHTLWSYCSVVIRQWSSRTRHPYLITANGMLEPWALNNSRLKKQLALWLYERACLRDGACLQVNSEAELQSVRRFGLRNPVCVIPNGIDLPTIENTETLKTENLKGPDTAPISESQHVSISPFAAKGRKVLLYLGRIHPKKGLVNLLKAWARVNAERGMRNAEWVLAVAGWDQGGHEAELKRLATELCIPWADARELKPETGNQEPETVSAFSFQLSGFSLLFLGPQFGPAKAACYANCDAFILPSYSEGLPMVVLEAWAYGKPVLMTPECNLPEGFAANAAIRIETNVESIAAGLAELFRNPQSAIRNLGENGRQLVASRFTWPTVAQQMKSVYDWLLGGGPKPEWVR